MMDCASRPSHRSELREFAPPGSGEPLKARAAWRSWQHFVGLGRLMRLSNSLPAAAAVLLGAKLAAGQPPGRAWLAAASMWSITAFGYASNDLWDLTEDRINKPGRPLVTGVISPQVGRWWSMLLVGVALSLAAALGWRELAVASVVVGLLTLYSLRLKATPGGGNLLIALLAGATLVTGAVAAGGFTWSAVSAVLPASALLSTFIAARELLKTLEDVAGDRIAGKHTVAVAYGERRVVYILGVLAVLTGLFSILPVLWGDFSSLFLFLVVLGLLIPLVFTISFLWLDASPGRVTLCLRLLKASYFVGLVALLVAK
jgi:geranylgeranylglycerol-phosphate geranylgeranyltransferase